MNANETMVKMTFDRWYALLKNCDTIFSSMSDEQLLKEIAPGRNRGIYILGHLIAVHDNMLILLGMGDKLYPELNEPFINQPDRAIADLPSVTELKHAWSIQNEAMKEKFDRLTADEWFGPHTAVSAEEHIKEPHRNKLNIIFTRTTHLAYHVGQLALVKA